MTSERDLELNKEMGTEKAVPAGIYEDGDAVPGTAFEHEPGWRGTLNRFAAKLGVEQRGIERVPEDERHDNSILNIGTMVR